MRLCAFLRASAFTRRARRLNGEGFGRVLTAETRARKECAETISK
jgi:hypothetical protein